MFFTSEWPLKGGLEQSNAPGAWDDTQVMASTAVQFTPASGEFAGIPTHFLYFRANDDLLSLGGVVNIGMMSQSVAAFDGRNWRQRSAPVIAANAVGSAPVAGGVYNDMAAVIYNNRVRLFVNIYDNPNPSNRMVIFESADGINFSYLGEATFSGAYFGKTVGPLWNIDGTLVGLFPEAVSGLGNRKVKRISTDGGLTWTARGAAINIGTAGDWNGFSLVVGRAYEEGGFCYAMQPGMPYIGLSGSGAPYIDWPEACGVYRCPRGQMLDADTLFEAYPQNPVILRGAFAGGIWQPTVIKSGGSYFVTVQIWGMAGFHNINSAAMNTLRNTPYAGLSEKTSTKHIYQMEMRSRMWLDRWDYDPFPAGQYVLRNVVSGQYLALDGTAVIANEQATLAEFAVAREMSFHNLTIAGKVLTAPSRADGAQLIMASPEAPDANQAAQWHMGIWEDSPTDAAPLVVITNRFSSLALAIEDDADINGAAVVQRPFVGQPEMIWQLIEVIEQGAEAWTADEDVGSALPTSLPAGDLLGSLGSQTAQHLAVVDIPRAEAVARNLAGEWNSLPNGARMRFGGHDFARLAGAPAIDDLLGWVPLEPLHIRQFASEAVLTANASAAIRAARLYARSLAAAREMDGNDSGLGVSVEIDMSGPIWPITAPLDGSGTAGVRLANGALKVVAAPDPVVDVTWPNGLRYAYALVLGGADNDLSSHQGARNLLIDCKGLAAGIGAINTRGSVATDIQILNWRGIGLDVRSPAEGNRGGACDFQRIRGPAYPIGSTGGNLLANRNCIGLRDHRADNTYTDIGFSRCGVSSEIAGYGSHVHTDCHPFEGGVVDFPTYTVLGVTNNGGNCRIEVASTSGMTSGDLYIVPWLPGVSDVSFARSNAYPITVDDGTHFTAVGCPFGGTFDTEADPVVVTPWAAEMICVRILPSATDVHFRGQLDRGKMQIIDDGAHGAGPSVFFDAFATGMAVDTMRTGIELVADGVVGAKFAGVRGTISGAKTALRLVGINGGSVSTNLQAQIKTHNENGKPPVRTGLVTVPAGSASQPGLRASRDPGYDATAFGSTDGIYFDADGNMCTSAEQVGRTKFSPTAFEQLNNTALGTVLNPWQANLKMVSMRGTLADLMAADAAGTFGDLPEGAIVWVGQVAFAKQTDAGYDGLPVNFIPAMDYVSPKWWGGTWDGVADDTEVIRRAHAFCNATGLPFTYAGIEKFGIQRAARISVQTSGDFAGAVWRFVDGLLEGTSFSVTDVTAAFVIEDPDAPAIVETVTVGAGVGQIPAASLVAGSKRPTDGYWAGPGYVRIASGGTVYAAARYLGGGTMVYEQPFWLSPEGLAVWPLEADLSADTSVTITRRANSARGQIAISGIVLDVSTCNCQTLLEIARNQVSVQRMSFVGAMPAYHRHGLIRALDAGAVTLDDMPLHAFDNDPNVSSRPFNFRGAAEVRMTRIIAQDGWGQMGSAVVSGLYLANSSINRMDVHEWGFNFFADLCSFESYGAAFGCGGGIWQLSNCQFNDAKAAIYHREDFDGAAFNMTISIINPKFRDPDSTARAVDWKTYPVGSPAAVISLPHIIEVTNLVRTPNTGVANDTTITRAIGVAVAANAAGVYTSKAVRVDGVTVGQLGEVLAIEWPVLDLTPLAGGKTQITTNNIGATKTAGAIERCTVTVPDQVLVGAAGAPFVLRASNNSNFSVQAPSASSSEFQVYNCLSNRIKTAARQVRINGGRLKYPVYFSPETKAPVGSTRSGTADLYTSIHDVDIEASDFTLASASVLAGVVIPAALSPTMPTDSGTGLAVTHAQALTGWAQNGFL